MKHTHLFIALALCAIVATSCNNNKKPQKEVVEAAKIVLAEETLATLDNLAQQYFEATGNLPIEYVFRQYLTKEQLLVKPDYLLDPKEADKMVTKSQKLNALAVYILERHLREVYEMPLDEVDAAIAKLAAETNHQYIHPEKASDITQILKDEYNKYKERNELALFWKFHYSVVTEILYLVSQNPDVFFDNITEEQYQMFHKQINSCINALVILSDYDSEIALIMNIHLATNSLTTDKDSLLEKANGYYSNKDNGKNAFIQNKDLFAKRRAKLLE